MPGKTSPVAGRALPRLRVWRRPAEVRGKPRGPALKRRYLTQQTKANGPEGSQNKQGQMHMRTTVWAGVIGACTAVAALAGAAGTASAQELSEKSIRTFMDYAWSLTPQQLYSPRGQATMGALITCSTVNSLWKWALGFKLPLWWFFTAIWAIRRLPCSRVSP